MTIEARIDKWLWAVRLFKTRTQAAEACKKGRVMLGNASAKPARMVKEGDVVQVRKPPITYSFKVLQPLEKRVSAKLAVEAMLNVTTPDQIEILEMTRYSGFIGRGRGLGRPTKKERRDLDQFTDSDDDMNMDDGFEFGQEGL